MSYKLVHFQKGDDFCKIENEWRRLQEASRESSVFIKFDWVNSVWRAVEGSASLHILTVWKQSKLVGVLPLSIIENRAFGPIKLKMLTHLCFKFSDFSEVLIDPRENVKDVLKILVKEIEKLSTKVDLIKFDNLSSADQNAKLLLKTLRNAEFNSSYYPNVENPILDLSNDSFIDKKQVKDVNRRLRRLKEKHSIQILIGQSIDDKAWQNLLDFHKEQFFGVGFSSNESQNFYSILMGSPFAKCNIEFSYVTIDDEIAAVHFGFKDANQVYYYVPGYSRKFAKNGVGQILLNELIEHYRNSGANVFNMLRGGENYKLPWMSNLNFNLTFLASNRNKIKGKLLVFVISLLKAAKGKV